MEHVMTKTKVWLLAGALAACCLTAGARAETPEEWVKLGARVHGAFGSFIPVGIRIGLDALQRLDAQPRGVTVVYYSGPKSPCPCPADGIAIATMASVGQNTLRVAPEKAPEDALGVAVIRSKATGVGFKYTIAASWIPKLIAINKEFDPMGRYDAVMNAPDLFSVEPMPAPESPPK
jgi:FmdE, Molybdenum formylmethanofuran dehydrogenase operon